MAASNPRFTGASMTRSRRPQSAGPAAAAGPALTGPALTGPAGPQPHVSLPDDVDCLPHQQQRHRATLWWVGAHGGAGESTLAALLPQSYGTGHSWPVTPASAGDGANAVEPVVLVARTNMSGLRAAQHAAAQWAAGGTSEIQLLGLVLIADAPGRLPRPLRDFADVVAGGVPRVWWLPWIEAWRLGQDPAAGPIPRSVRRLLADLHTLLNTGPTIRNL